MVRQKRQTVPPFCAWMSGWSPPSVRDAIIGKAEYPCWHCLLWRRRRPGRGWEQNLGSENLSTFSQFIFLK